MRTRNRTRTPLTTPTAILPAAPCGPCDAGHHHCHGTLVLHADGTVECDDVADCACREDLHDWWIACVEIGCGCTGDEQPLLLLAA
jgi:hypothetical protein